MPSMFVVTPVCVCFFMLEFVVGLQEVPYILMVGVSLKEVPCMLMFVLSLQEVVCLPMVGVSLQEVPCMLVCCVFTGGHLYSYGWHQFTGGPLYAFD